MKKALLSILLLAGAVYLFGVWLPPASVPTASIAASAPVEAEPLADPSWQQVKEKGCLVIGVDDAFPPMTFLDESGQLTGLDIELAQEVCDALGIRAEFQPISWVYPQQTFGFPIFPTCLTTELAYNRQVQRGRC